MSLKRAAIADDDRPVQPGPSPRAAANVTAPRLPHSRRASVLLGVALGLVFSAVFVGRPAWEARKGLALGLTAEAAGDLETARLRYGEARLWRAPPFPFAAEAEARLARLPASPDAALGGAARDAAPTDAFGRRPHAAFALLGGLALVGAIGAAARWALTARRVWGGFTLLAGVVAALALGAA